MDNLFFLLLSCWSLQQDVIAGTDATKANTWYVSLAEYSNMAIHLGDIDRAACGHSLVLPCRSLLNVIHRAQPGDFILIDGKPTSGSSGIIYEMCHDDSTVMNIPIEFKPLHLGGYNGRPKIGCSLPYKDAKHVVLEESPVDVVEEFVPVKKYDNILNFENYNTYNISDSNNTKTTYTIYDVIGNDLSHTTTHNELNYSVRIDILTTKAPVVDSSSCNFSLIDIEIVNGIVYFANCTISISNSIFNNASFSTSEPCAFVNVKLNNVSVDGEVVCSNGDICNNKVISNVTCANVDLSVNASIFRQTTLIAEGTMSTKINVSSSIFSNKQNKLRFLGGLHLTFLALNAIVDINNSTFEKQVHPNLVQSVINLYEAAIWLKAKLVSPKNISTNAIASIQNCTFYDNERGITIIGPFQTLKIAGSVFKKNVAMHAGAAILILITETTKAWIDNVDFSHNKAGTFRNDYPVINTNESITIVGTEVHLNTSCCKGVIDFVGKGGAIRIQRGTTIIHDCTFKNNTARLLGGSVFVDIDGKVTINETKFENSPFREHAMQGDILYSDGDLKINKTTFIVKSATNGLSIFRHSGDHWTLDITNVWIQCPVEYNLRTTNSSAYGVMPNGLRRSYKLDQLSYFCESCPRNKYSLDHGYINYTMVFHDFAYFTLLINGSEPEPQYTGNYIHHKIQCEDCPYGGHCVQGITSVANFWGFEHEDEIQFQHCPKGYCCSSPECPSIDSCNRNRQGRLCGRCKEGFSEALFISDCIPNEQCRLNWIPGGIVIGLVYSVLLLFQADMQQFLFSKPLGLKNIFSICIKTKPQPRLTYMNGLAGNEENQDGTDVKFIPNGSEIFKPGETNNHQNQANLTESRQSEKDNKGFGSGFLVIMFYYFQDALLLNVKTIYVSAESKVQQIMKNVLSGIFKFQLDVFEIFSEVCIGKDMRVVQKQLVKALIVPYVLGLFVLFYVCYYGYSWLRRTNQPVANRLVSDTDFGRISTLNSKKNFKTRLSSGFILALLFMFQKLGTTTFVLLNCVPIRDDMVLFIDGTIKCYEGWQYIVMGYSIACVSPFFLVLLVGPSLLQQGKIKLWQFFVASLIPLPFLIWWVVYFSVKSAIQYHRKDKSSENRKPTKPLPRSVQAVLQILQGPYRPNSCGLCWSGVLIGRRLVLILLFTFITDTLIRLLCMLLACFVILLHHVHVKPYKDSRGNLAGTLSASALVMTGSINLVRAGFEAAEYTPAGPNASLMNVFDEIENVLLLWGPLCILACIVLVFIFRVITHVCSKLCTGHSTSINVPAAVSEDPAGSQEP